LALCASPAYLAAAGLPLQVQDLAQHRGLALKIGGTQRALPWRLKGPEGAIEWPVSGPLRCNDFLSLSEACCAGLGLAQLPLVVALPALRAGQLKVVLPDSAPTGLRLFMHYPDRQLPARVRVFVDFVTAMMQSHPDLDVPAAQFVAAAPKWSAPNATATLSDAPVASRNGAQTKGGGAKARVRAAPTAPSARRK
jgi:DNA-binding transcriptional LysR family regulator